MRKPLSQLVAEAASKLLVLTLIGGLVIWVINSPESTPASRRADVCAAQGRVTAEVGTVSLVRDRLLAPATASFPSASSNYRTAWSKGCSFSVSSYVDAQNGFGAHIRSSYTAQVRYDPEADTWYLDRLT